jgi:hypothetical protein
MMVQPYLASVEGHGERALVAIAGTITHAVRKQPRFSGQHEHVSDAVPISPAERSLAERALAVATARFPRRRLLYGRVDMTLDRRSELVLMELELIEPSLFFVQCPSALERFVAEIGSLFGRSGHGARTVDASIAGS